MLSICDWFSNVTIEVANKDNLETFNSQRESNLPTHASMALIRTAYSRASASMRHIPTLFPHVNMASEKLLNPGEHYRIEVR